MSQPKVSDGELLFPGNSELVGTLAKLYAQSGGRQDLPLVCLVRGREAPEILPALSRRVRGGLVAQHTLRGPTEIDPASTEPLPPTTVRDVFMVRALLAELAGKLGGPRQGRRAQIRRFRRFALVSFLMRQSYKRAGMDDDADTRERYVRRVLRGRSRFQIAKIPNDLEVPAWLRAVTIASTALLYRARISGRVLLLSGYYRWFVRRDSLAPPNSGGFPSVAVELTKDAWPNQPHAMLLFLVNSFIEDIRAEYRRPFRRYFGARRTSNCLLMISNISRDNGGYQLLRAINSIRNVPTLDDPLLVVTESWLVPPFAESPDDGRVEPADKAPDALASWCKNIAEKRRNKAAVAWFLRLRIPPVPHELPRSGHQRPDLPPPLRVSPEPYRRRVARAALAAAPLVAAASLYGWYSQAHCGNGLSWPGMSPTVFASGPECMGLSDDPETLFNPLDADIQAFADRVKTLNEQVEGQHRRQPNRPLITLVYLGALSVRDAPASALAAQVEGLKGLAIAQQRQLNQTASTAPLVRVLMANAGARLTHGAEVARTIGEAARTDPTLVGVVGLSQSYRGTAETVRALAAQGIPTVAGTISADEFADRLPMYYQISPQNRREAEVAARYAESRMLPDTGVDRSVRIYFSDDADDLYSNNLADDIQRAFQARGFAVSRVAFTPDGGAEPSRPPPADLHLPNPGDAGRDACRHLGIVFWAGRPLPEFGSFLGTARNCPKHPVVLAGNDTTRYVADELARRQYPSIPYDYLALAAAPSGQQEGPEQDFYSGYARMFPARPGASLSLDGHGALAHDAAQVFIAAAELLRARGQEIALSPGAVWRQIGAISNPGLRAASGTIDFGGRVDRKVPVNKLVPILRVRGGEVDPEVLLCGPPPPTEPRTQPWCPLEGVTPPK